jgi:regulator of protease activity HflC (stomatin/prohibitin superfamily)
MNIIANVLYRPTENHVGVIYRFGRFGRFVDPDRWSVLLPGIDSVEKETKLDMRTTHLQLTNVYTRDHVAIDLELKIFHMVDLRQVSPERLIQVLRFPTENAWDEIVRTGITDITRNQIVVSRSFAELTTPEGRSHLKQLLSFAIAERVRGFGILVNERFGVSIINLQPNEAFQEALKEETVAKTVGSAAVDRLRPFFEQFGDQDQAKAFIALVMQIASAVAKNGQSPDIIFPNTNDFLAGAGIGKSNNGPNGPVRQKIQRTPQSGNPQSLAGD